MCLYSIPREEVEEINRTIMGELSHIQKGCKSVIAGGYRRGKPQSNDVDIVITHTIGT
jgi:DNA polymerase mu